tara:strand:+ start:15578 stop:16846 length:1269 start_codon:yes stop_codon:yes gene_type:complete
MNNKKIITPIKVISGSLEVPSSKSYAQRAIALSSLSRSEIELEHLTYCDDVVAAIDVARELGSSVNQNGRTVRISGGFDSGKAYAINCGEAGLSTRLFSAFSLLSTSEFKVSGSGSILSRPMDMVVDAMEQAGKNVTSNGGKLPLSITGKTNSKVLEIDGSTSSQLLTGLLIVAPFLPVDLTIKVNDLKSIPYVEMTLETLRSFGLIIENNNFGSFTCKGNQSIDRPIVYDVEGDWSGASFLIVAGLVGGKVLLKGLKKESLQADIAILKVADEVGGKLHWEGNDLIVEKDQLKPFCVDATNCPDLFPPLVALAAMINGESRISGVHRLKHKESDRASALIKEFTTLGINVFRENDELVITGLRDKERINGAEVFAHGDHRMAMALALMSIRSKKEIAINGADSIAKSYPGFYDDLTSITAK